jgi:glycosyltransferase involved in cell wall biosynthesis
MRFELGAGLRQDVAYWDRILARNAWFQGRGVAWLEGSGMLHKHHHSGKAPTVFAYSYAARRILKAARDAGCRTILGQIDPAIHEEHVVAELHRRHPALNSDWQPAPKRYWAEWREEISLADRVIVNSRWARDALKLSGVPDDKIRIVPLGFEPPKDVPRGARVYPKKFTEERPLKLLFLGSLTLRKGVAELLEAAQLLVHAPVVTTLIGPESVHPPRAILNKRIRWLGAVPRAQVHAYYRDADAFILPTHSDGFALTQLEAQAWGLPIIASRFCGEVIADKASGLLLPEVTAKAIADAIRRLLDDPSLLARMSNEAIERSALFTPAAVLGELSTDSGQC